MDDSIINLNTGTTNTGNVNHINNDQIILFADFDSANMARYERVTGVNKLLQANENNNQSTNTNNSNNNNNMVSNNANNTTNG